jgi:peptide/nickel transport system permease protein
MQQYIIKRLLVMIPTLFAITLIIFIILQIAPGRPGGPSSGESESAGKQVGQDGYRIYKQQFHLDKPILFNLRFMLSTRSVMDLLRDRFGSRTEVSSREKNYATETLQDYGSSIVGQLARIIANPPNLKLRDQALRIFRDNAQRPLVYRYGERLDEDQRSMNQEIEAENKRLDRFAYSPNMTEPEKRTLVDKVLAYYDDIRDRYDYSVFDKARIFFLDTRFAYYLKNLLHLDFGVSFVDRRPVMPKILDRLQYSVILSGLSIFLAYLFALPIGIYSAVFSRTLSDQIATVTLFMLYSLPTFFAGTVLLFLFSEGGEHWHWFPTGGFESLATYEMTTLRWLLDVSWHMILPVTCLTYISLASLSRYARTGLLDVIHSDYIKTARAKGLPESVVILKHAVRNGLIPILTLLGSILPTVVSGSVIIEVIFNLPGIGYEAYQAVLNRDYNMVMGIQLISAVLTLVGLLISDLLYAIVDPRITYD